MIGGSTLLTLLNDTDEDARLSAELNRELGRFAEARAILNRLQPTARLNTPKTLPPNAHDAPLPPSPIFDEEESEEAFRERVIPILRTLCDRGERGIVLLAADGFFAHEMPRAQRGWLT